MNDQKQNRVFDKWWFAKHQDKLLRLANSWLGRKIFGFDKLGHNLIKGVPISVITPNAVHQNLGVRRVKTGGQKRGILKQVYQAHFFTDNAYAKRLYFMLFPMWWSMHIWDFFVADYFTLAPKLSFGFSTLTVNPDASSGATTVDGNMSRASVSETFSTIRSGAGNASNVSLASPLIRVRTNTTSGRYDEFRRIIATFDTSSLTSGATISAGVVSAYGVAAANSFAQTPDIDIVSATPASNNNLVDADYSQLGTTPYASIAVGSFTTSVYNDFTLDSTGRATISKTGITKFGFRVSFDTDNAEPTWGSEKEAAFQFNSGDAASNKLKLVVTYTTTAAPTVTTQAVTVIDKTTATGNGNVTSDGGATITERGVVWSTSANPTTSDSKATAAGTTGAYTASITGLTKGTLYHVRAYAINSVGTSYGSDVTFTTKTDATITKSLQYAVKPTIAVTKSLKYTVKITPTAVTKSLKYVVTITPSALTKGLIYRVSITPSALTKSLRYAVSATPSAITKSLQYAVSATPSAITKSLKYTVTIAQTAITKALKYVVTITPAAITKALTYSVNFQSVALTKSLQYAVTAATAITKSLKYTVGTTPAAITKSLQYAIGLTAALTKSLQYVVVSTPAALTKSLTYRVLFQTTSITKGLQYSVNATPAALTKSLKYTVGTTPAALTKSLQYEVNIIIEQLIQKSLKYTVILTPAALTKSLQYAVGLQGNITKSMKYAVMATPAALTKSLKYSVGVSTAISKGLQYSVTAPAALTKSLQYTLAGVVHGSMLSMTYVIRIYPYQRANNPYTRRTSPYVKIPKN